MITRNGKDLVARFVGRRAVVAVYVGKKLVWQNVRSCFGNGYWKNGKPWKNDEAWKNGNKQ